MSYENAAKSITKLTTVCNLGSINLVRNKTVSDDVIKKFAEEKIEIFLVQYQYR